MFEEVLSGFLQVLFELVIVAVVPAAVGVAVAWLKVQQRKIEAELPANVLNVIAEVAAIVTQAAEQSELSGWLEKEGMKKKEWAMQEGEKLLKEHLGLMLDLDGLGDSFWAAVLAGLDANVEVEVFRGNSYGAFNRSA